MGGGAADQGQASMDPRPGTAVLEHRSEPAPHLLRQRHGLPEMAALPIPDEILAEIFLRLPTPAELIRASGACVSFRRVAARRSFVRRFRKLHAPPLLGFLDKHRTFYPAISPHPSAPAASATALAVDFSFSFLPAARDWVVQDSRDGRFLLDRPRLHDASDHRVLFTEMVVCDPLHRRYLLLPPIPDDLAASVEDPFPLDWQCLPETFLVPSADDEQAADVEDTSFGVICMFQCRFKLFAFGFSSITGQWLAVPSLSWSDLFAGLVRQVKGPLYSRQYAYACFYWMIDFNEEKRMLVLDTRRMEFSSAELPPEAINTSIFDRTMVEAGEGKPGMFVLVHGTSDLNYTIMRYSGGSSSQWQSEKTISLGSGYSLRGSVGRHLLLFRCARGMHDSKPCYFTLDIRTFQLERVCSPGIGYLYAYSNFPPPLLSSPTI